MNSGIVFELMTVSMMASVISSQVIQKIKETLKLGNLFNKIISLFVSYGIGFCYAYSFYSDYWLYAIWIGLFTMIGSEKLYQSFKGKFGLESVSKNKKDD